MSPFANARGRYRGVEYERLAQARRAGVRWFGLKTKLSRFGLGSLVALWLALACGGGSRGYPAAGLGLGTMVALTAVNRALTGDCWAVCSTGYACDRARGVCVRTECVPQCTTAEHCVREQDGRFRCIDKPGTVRLGARVRPPLTDAGVAQDAALGLGAAGAVGGY